MEAIQGVGPLGESWGASIAAGLPARHQCTPTGESVGAAHWAGYLGGDPCATRSLILGGRVSTTNGVFARTPRL